MLFGDARLSQLKGWENYRMPKIRDPNLKMEQRQLLSDGKAHLRASCALPGSAERGSERDCSFCYTR